MKIIICFFSIILTIVYSNFNRNVTGIRTMSQATTNRFLGQWAISIQGGSVGWLEVRQNDNYLEGEILWGGGSVTPVSSIFMANNETLVVTRSNSIIREKEKDSSSKLTQVFTNWLEIKRVNRGIEGILLSPRLDGSGVDTTKFSGIKLPYLPSPPDLTKLKFGSPITLFNGKDLKGWSLIDKKKENGFSVVDGVLVSNPVQTDEGTHIKYGNLRTDKVFGDFNLKMEVNVAKGSNSGIYLQGKYEVQVVDSYMRELNSHHMGAIYSRITPVTNAEKPAGSWQTFDITLCDRHVTVILNNIKIIDNQPVKGPTGGAIIADVFAEGPIYIQGDEGGKVQFRNIVLTPIIKVNACKPNL